MGGVEEGRGGRGALKSGEVRTGKGIEEEVQENRRGQSCLKRRGVRKREI